VRGHSLGVFQSAARVEIGGDPGRAEHVAAKLDLEAGIGRAPARRCGLSMMLPTTGLTGPGAGSWDDLVR